jgi:transposase
MLEVETNHQIILLYYREGLSQRKIAKQLNIHRHTVKARIQQYEQFKAAPLSDQDKPASLLNQYLRTGSVYNSASRSRRRLTGEVLQIIDTCLQENELKRLDGRTKQQLKKIDIHEKILSAGHQISYSVLCAYISRIAAATKEAFIKQGYAAGSCCEFDWAEVKLMMDGKLRKFYLAVFTSAFSNYRHALLFQRQDSLAFKEAHISFFEHVGGVYHQVVYDNMRVAIAEFVGRSEKVPTEALLQLSRWYQYQWRFCNTAKGNEKGHVERSVEYIRRKVFAFKDDYKTFQEAQEYLQARVAVLNDRAVAPQENSPATKLAEEHSGLYTHPGRMECFTGENHKVDKYATICFATNRYSVPDHLIGRMVFIKIYSHWIKIYDTQQVLCNHSRIYERHGWQIDLQHYLVTFQRKPGAVAGSIALKQAPPWVQLLYHSHYQHDARSFIDLLQYRKEHDISSEVLCACINKLASQFPSNVSNAHIIALLGNQPEAIAVPANEPDPIAVRSMENLLELTAMMNYN